MSENSSKTLKAKKTGSWSRSIGYSLWALVAGFAVPGIVIALIVGFVMAFYELDASFLEEPVWLVSLFAAQYTLGLFVLLILPVLFQKMKQIELKKLFGVNRWPKLSDFGLAIIFFFVYFVAAFIVQQLAMMFLQGYDPSQAQDVGFKNVTAPIELVLAFIALVVLAPIAEELIFRGYLYGALRKELSFVLAALITSVLFGVVHGQWNVGIDTFVLSIALCHLRERTGAVWSSIFLHAIKNSLAFFVLFVLPALGINLI